MSTPFFHRFLAVCALAAPLAHAQSSPYDIPPVPTLDGIAVFYNKVGRVTFGSDGSVRTDRVGPVIDGGDAGQMHSEGPLIIRVGEAAVHRDGAAFVPVGKSTVVGEGITYKRLGNTIFGSDGSTYIEMGGTIVGSDGSRYVRAGTRLVRTEEGE